ncbi:hypothetical protein NQ317_013967 [Molorchus minor]|uniref:DUF5641 domain-containing protein n=1 Tax=Molorchus minor TaxID=1323400 RepID=A0ABQ9J178_9CUCU|nr:hypothetical protein NQ317_013967 [Molorchus minor]
MTRKCITCLSVTPMCAVPGVWDRQAGRKGGDESSESGRGLRGVGTSSTEKTGESDVARLLCPLLSDPSDDNQLTPVHFLIGKTLTALLKRSVIEIPESRLSKYQRLQQWKLGRIVQLYPGDDSIVRVASIKVGESVFKRATSRVCVLPIHQESGISSKPMGD